MAGDPKYGLPDDPPVSVWKEQCVVESVEYLDKAYRSAVKFINMQMSGH